MTARELFRATLVARISDAWGAARKLTATFMWTLPSTRLDAGRARVRAWQRTFGMVALCCITSLVARWALFGMTGTLDLAVVEALELLPTRFGASTVNDFDVPFSVPLAAVRTETCTRMSTRHQCIALLST